MFPSLFALSTALALTAVTAVDGQTSITSFSYAIRGNAGNDRHPNNAEFIHAKWKATNGSYYTHLSNKRPNSTFERFTVNTNGMIPTQVEVDCQVCVGFDNGGVTVDRSLYIDPDFRYNGVTVNTAAFSGIDGPMIWRDASGTSFTNTEAVNNRRMTGNGVFHIRTPSYLTLSMRGKLGTDGLGVAEQVLVHLFHQNGTIAYPYNLTLSKTFTTFRFVVPGTWSLRQIRFSFSNYRSAVVNGVTYSHEIIVADNATVNNVPIKFLGTSDIWGSFSTTLNAGAITLTNNQVAAFNSIDKYSSVIDFTPGLYGQRYEGHMWDNSVGLGKSSLILSPGRTSSLDLTNWGTVRVTYMSVETYIAGRNGNVNLVKVTQDGRLLIGRDGRDTMFWGNAMTCNGNVAGSWRLTVPDDMRVRILCADGVTSSWNIGLDYTGFLPWGIEQITGQTLANWMSARNRTLGAGTVVSYLDSGINIGMHDTLNLIQPPGSARIGWTNMQGTDYNSHSTNMVNLLRNTKLGLAESSLVSFGRVTLDSTSAYYQKDTVWTMFVGTTSSSWSSQFPIHNLSGDNSDNDPYVNCAMQYAASAGATVFVAAGNENQYLTQTHPYKFVVGAYSKPVNGVANVASYSGYGPGVDIWAPAEYISPTQNGTSFSTSYVSAVAAAAISRYPTILGRNPQALYRYLADLADMNLISATDSKVASSPNAGRKSLSMARLTTVAPSTASTYVYHAAGWKPDFCGPLGIGIATTYSNGDWYRLESYAQKLKVVGKLVTTSLCSPPLLDGEFSFAITKTC